MADDNFRLRRPGQEPDFIPDGETIRNMAGAENESKFQPESTGSFSVSGNIPSAFQAAINAKRQGGNPVDGNPQPVQRPTAQMSASGAAKSFTDAPQSISGSSGHLRELLENLRGKNAVYEEVQLPSKGRFYNGEDGPTNGIVAIRPMTGEEEQILATPRFVRKGQAINMIFEKCLRENIRAENLLTTDRTYLLIYLRGISYGTNYDVEIKCPECEKKFSTSVDLSGLYVEPCPNDYGPALQDILPNSKLPFAYRHSTGRDEQEITEHRDRRIKAFGDTSADDTLHYRTALLLDHIDGITGKTELQLLLKNLPIADVNYIRGLINEPPFGVDTNVEIVCPSCLQEFNMDLPLESNFFFPKRKKGKLQRLDVAVAG